VWGLLVHVIEGVVFALTGLQAHIVTEGLDDQGWRRLAFASVLMTVVVVVVRFIWVIPATFIPGWLFPKYRAKGQPPWQYAFLIGFTGIRGVVSMAAALSIPVYVGSELFPERSLLICVTFFVIMASLFGMGTSLPFVIRLLGLSEIGAAEAADAKRTEIAARISGIDAVLARLKELEEVAAAAPILLELRRRHELRRRRYVAAFDGDLSPEQIAGEAALELEVVEAERANLAELYNNAAISDEARRRVERELDIEDALVRHAAQSASSGMPDALG
jgi:CPA1 family monovalent cation:H+ antiporter